MSSQYYYFAASLPLLNFDSEPPLSSEEFLSESERLLSAQDWGDMQAAFAEKSCQASRGRNKTLRAWSCFLKNLRNEGARLRAAKANKNPLDYIRGDFEADPFIMEVLEDAMKASDPLEAENILDQASWKFLDELSLQHYFDLDFLIIYGMRIRILERRQEVRSEQGSQILEEFKKESLAFVEKQ